MINKFSHSEDDKPFHSNGYAQTSQGNMIGSTNAQSFGQRAHIERNRSSVQRYGASMVGQGYIHRDVAPRVDGFDQAASRPSFRSASRSSIQQPQRRFVEPPPRHNPYA